ncbi:MAG: MarR family winged helix-turn-helix transcriptional regulator [Myxococcota bacterium]
MSAKDIYGALTQLGAVLRAEARIESGLQPVQVQVLNYLSICNRYSDTPVSVADYLGLTKGTVSQTLRVLTEAGFVDKRPDPHDGRVVHLRLTAKGKATVAGSVPPPVLRQAVASLSESDQSRTLESFRRLLGALQQANDGLSFGICHTCQHFLSEGRGRFRCGLTEEPLKAAESKLICREHLT